MLLFASLRHKYGKYQSNNTNARIVWEMADDADTGNNATDYGTYKRK